VPDDTRLPTLGFQVNGDVVFFSFVGRVREPMGDSWSGFTLRSAFLPEFQRGYVWNRTQVRGLSDSLYLRHPVGRERAV
jgi:hypothetical protein